MRKLLSVVSICTAFGSGCSNAKQDTKADNTVSGGTSASCIFAGSIRECSCEGSLAVGSQVCEPNGF